MGREDAEEQIPLDDDAPTGGSDTSEEQLHADNEVEQDMIDSIDPAGPPD